MLKQFIQTALLLVVLCTTATSYAQIGQSPDGIQFQALATDANGHPAAGRVIYVKDAIVAKTATGTIVYSETFKVTASSAGVFTIVLGKGTYASGVTSIANIDWSNGPFFLNLKIAVEPTVPVAGWNVNNEYVDLGTSQFWSVPYALYAGNVKGADGKLNTSDTAAMLKPYFTAINLKANIESPTFTGTVRGITKAMVGLGNVDNTADLDKPVSTATKTALDLKANATDVTTALALKANATDVTSALDLKVDKVTGKALSTNDYTTAEKTKLAAITGTNTGDQDLSALAIAADVSAALALKANTAEVNSALDTKVSSADATAALALKANIADVNAALALKANGANVANSLALKANTADVNNALALKADNLTVTNQLATKEDKLNKSVDVAVDGALDTKYPSVKAVKTYVDAQVAGATIADANNTTKGKIQLAGDLAGTAAAPTVPGLALKAPIASPTFTGTVTAPTYASTPIALTYTGSNINWNPAQGLNAAITLTQNSGLNFTVAPPVGSYGTVVLTQDATGSRTITLPTIAGATNKVLGSTSTSTVALSTAANSKDILNFYFDGTSCYWNIGQGYGAANQAPFTLTTTGTGAATLVGTTLNIPNVSSTNANSLTGVVPIANGGTGTTTVAGIKSVLGFNSSSVAIGDQAGQTNQGSSTVGVGGGAGATNQGNGSVAVGYVAGYNNQGSASIAMGSNAAQSGQGTQAVALGYAAGQNGQGDYSVAVGSFAGNVQAANSIALNATGTSLNPSTTGFFVAPIRNASSSSSLFYNSTTKEITYGAPAASGVPYTGATGAVNLGAYELTANGVTIGRGASSRDHNYAYGYAVLSSNTTGNYNNAFGHQALTANTTGQQNNAFGEYALPKNIGGNYNTAMGSNAMRDNTSGSGNTGFGQQALLINSTGSNNTALGNQADVTVDGLNNATAIGYNAKVSTSNTIQLGNTSVTDVKTSGAITSPIYASTPQVLTAGSTINWNPALGLNASVTLNQNSTISFSSTPTPGAYGTLVVTQDATGGRTLALPTATNKVLGSSSTTTIALSTTANAIDIVNFYYDGSNYFWNVGQGYGSAATATTTNLASSVTGTLPVANGGTGAATLTGYVKGTGTTALTASATIPVADVTGAAPLASPTFTGSPSLPTGTTGVTQAAGNNSTALATTAFVTSAVASSGLPSQTGNAGKFLTTDGTAASWASSAGVPYTGATSAVNLGAYDLTVNGLTVGKGKKDAGTAYQYNTALGVSALNSFTGGTKNTALGYNALSSVTSTDQNIAIGAYAMGSTSSYFQQSVAVGNQTMQYNAGSFNTAVGSNAATSSTLSGTYLVAVGAVSLNSNTSGSNNTAVGSYALNNNTTGSNNTALGQGADVLSSGLTNATAIGYNAKVATNNTIQLGNSSITNVKTSGTITAGAVTYPNTDGTANQVLTTNGSGTASWTTAARLNSDEFTATAGQTSFTLSQTALNAKVFMFINGTRIRNGAYSVSGTTVTYTAANNNSYVLVAGDRIQFDYAY